MNELIERLHPNLLVGLVGIFALLVVATAVVGTIRRIRPDLDLGDVPPRIRSWWIMVAIFTIAMVLDRRVSLTFFAFVSFLALKEYLSLIPTRRADRSVLLWAYAAIPVQYLWIGLEWYGMFIIWIPVYMYLFLPMRMVLIGTTDGFLRAAGTLHWGLMTTVFSISHVAFLLVLSPEVNPNGMALRWSCIWSSSPSSTMSPSSSGARPSAGERSSPPSARARPSAACSEVSAPPWCSRWCWRHT